MTLATIAEADAEFARNVGIDNRERAWICSDRDAWYRNGAYRAPEYAVVAEYDSIAGFFRQWTVFQVNAETGEMTPRCDCQVTSPLAAWRHLRYLEECDAIHAEMHPESDYEPEDIESGVRAALARAWGKAPR